MKVAFGTLGCRLNQFESEALASKFIEGGYEIVPFENKADIYIINTCTVTNKADRKSRNFINRALNESGKTGGLVIVTGCFVENHKKELEEDGRTFVIGNADKSGIFSYTDALVKGEAITREQVNDLFAYTPSRVYHTRGMIKIQEGCDNFCSFCIIPHVRGRGVSRPWKQIKEEFMRCLDMGYKELVLTGVNISRYKDEDLEFSGLMEKLLDIPGDFRLRLSSLEPEGLEDKFINLFSHPKMTKHLHLCLQSASERILLQMRRQYTYLEFESIVEKLNKRYEKFNLTTDIITGFPGETEEDFSITLDAIKKTGFGHVHTFPYSRRTGTRAERMGEQIPVKEKKIRGEKIRLLSLEMKEKYRRSLIGMNETVLAEKIVEGPEALVVEGYSSRYVPVRFKLSKHNDPSNVKNNFFDVTLKDILFSGDQPIMDGEVLWS